jgi:hypothetical protein
MLVVVLFILALSIVFFILAYNSRQNLDEGAASINLTIGILLLIVDVIVFFLMVNLEHLYE